MRRALIITCVAAALPLYWSSGFSINRVTTVDASAGENVKEAPENIFNQTFTFLGSGVQCYAFLGEDEKTVLKLFKKRKRASELSNSAQIALEQLDRETGVFYTHLCHSGRALGTTFLYDKRGKKHQLDLDSHEFVLQHKAVTAEERLTELFQDGNIDGALRACTALLDLIEYRSQKGIKNKDGKIMRNCGFIGDRPVEIDIGSYIYRTTSQNPNPHHKARLRSSMQILSWIKKNQPEYFNTCKQKLLYENL